MLSPVYGASLLYMRDSACLLCPYLQVRVAPAPESRGSDGESGHALILLLSRAVEIRIACLTAVLWSVQVRQK